MLDSNLLQKVQIDEGAISHILKGADVMAPGLLSPGGYLPDNLNAGDIVVYILMLIT